MDAHPRLIEDGTEHPPNLRHRVGGRAVTRCRVRRATLSLAAVLASAGCASEGGQQQDATSTTSERPVELDAETFAVSGAPWGVVIDSGTAWVTDAAGGTVLQVDAATGEVVDEIVTGGPDPRDAGVALADGRLWIANLGGSVGVLDLATRQIAARATTGEGEPAAVVLDERWTWVPTHGPGGGLVRLERDDPRRDPLVLTLPESGFAAALVDGTVWVAGLERRVFAVDAATGTVLRTIHAGAAPRGIAVAAGDLWISLRDERAVVRVDPDTGDEVARIATGGQPWPIAAEGDIVWVATLDGRLLRIDPSTNAVSARATAGPDPRGVAITEDVVWVASQSGSVTRVAAG